MFISRTLFTGILLVLLNGVSSEGTPAKRDLNYDEALLEDTVFWGRETRKLNAMSMGSTTSGQSKLSVDVSCVSDKSGEDCAAIATPGASCGDGVDTLVFTFIGGDCGQGSNSQAVNCEDSNGGPPKEGEAMIECIGDNGETLVDGAVAVGSQVSFGDKKDLSAEISCTVKDNDGSTLQSFNIRTTDDDDLFLKDVFGSFQLENCDSRECLIEITFTYTIQNDGSTVLDITSVDRTREGSTDDVSSLVPDSNVSPGDSSSAQEPSILDICVKSSIVTIVEATAKPPSGKVVTSDGILVIETQGLPEREPCEKGEEAGGKGKGGKGGKKGGKKESYEGKGKGTDGGKKGGKKNSYEGKGKGTVEGKGGKGGKKGGKKNSYKGKGKGTDEGKGGKGGKKGGKKDSYEGKGKGTDGGKGGKGGKKGGKKGDTGDDNTGKGAGEETMQDDVY